jgi:hypothetical protein
VNRRRSSTTPCAALRLRRPTSTRTEGAIGTPPSPRSRSWPRIARSKLEPFIDVRRGSGSEALIFRNGSMLGLVSGTQTSGHGDSLDLGVIDEAWAQEDDHLEQAMRPAMMTRDAQLWVVSAAGTEKSAYFRAKVEDGRARAEMGVTENGCYIGYSAADDEDPGDPATWWRRRAERSQETGADYELMELQVGAYLCQWPMWRSPGGASSRRTRGRRRPWCGCAAGRVRARDGDRSAARSCRRAGNGRRAAGRGPGVV